MEQVLRRLIQFKVLDKAYPGDHCQKRKNDGVEGGCLVLWHCVYDFCHAVDYLVFTVDLAVDEEGHKQ